MTLNKELNFLDNINFFLYRRNKNGFRFQEYKVKSSQLANHWKLEQSKALLCFQLGPSHFVEGSDFGQDNYFVYGLGSDSQTVIIMDHCSFWNIKILLIFLAEMK